MTPPSVIPLDSSTPTATRAVTPPQPGPRRRSGAPGPEGEPPEAGGVPGPEGEPAAGGTPWPPCACGAAQPDSGAGAAPPGPKGAADLRGWRAGTGPGSDR